MARQQFFQGMNKTRLTETIRDIIKPYRMNELFTSDLISDLIVEKHYYCSVHGLRPTEFKKTLRPGDYGYDFNGCFDGRWNRVSWTRCISGQIDTDWIKRALRWAARPFVVNHKRKHSICERCGKLPSTEVDHVEPEFSVIADAAIAALSPGQIQEALKAFDWWKDEDFRLPDDSPAYQVVSVMHETAILMACCHDCHVLNARERKVIETDLPF